METLSEFGLNHSDAKIYVYLSKKGPQKARIICTEMKFTKQQLYPCLENLQKKGLVQATQERPATFHALPFEKAIDLFTNQKITEAQETQKHKTELLTAWQNMQIQDLT
jgi:sugar-specific transcriptional regulator TrmB